MRTVVYCVDVGSIPSGRLGWARVGVDGTTTTGDGVAAVDTLLDALRRDAATDVGISVGFETPLFVPLRDRPMELARVRAPWEHTSFAGGLGATVLVTGLVQLAYVLRAVERRPVLGAAAVGPETVHVWEAFISGRPRADVVSPSCPGGTHNPHVCDALVGAVDAAAWLRGDPHQAAVRSTDEFTLEPTERLLDLVATVTGGVGAREAGARGTILQWAKPTHVEDVGDRAGPHAAGPRR